MRRRLLLIAATLLLAIPLTYLLRNVARQVLLIQILRLAWKVRLLFESLPQTYLWTLLVAVAVLIVVRSLMVGGQPHPPPENVSAGQLGPLSKLTRQIQRARESEYARRGLARDVRALALEILAYQCRTTSEQLRRDLRAGTLDLPPEILAYLNLERRPAGSQVPNHFARLKHRLLRRAGAFRTDGELERVVQFLESELAGSAGPRSQIGGSE
jgi:hypothetical protein